ncbi:pentapeptide repeat-containing protein [Sinorhizobium sp. M4_45]|uniref:pentapeptide repeat-containing protein n=1 Tax=Sinorhizobium sp. M4_45 TaxID=2037901 RepID=UPI000C9AA73C|nr:pentapeptide repeat-containing protein [Sinorhizobium sp. M4_45]PND27630.1 hypothetical protein CN933_05750 [Sinorhizobium sp. M4_45]
MNANGISHPTARHLQDIEAFIQSGRICDSFAALREAHLMMKEHESDHVLVDFLPKFLTQAKKCGAKTESPRERSKAQSILDYWALQLAFLKPKDAVADVLLDPYEAPRLEATVADEASPQPDGDVATTIAAAPAAGLAEANQENSDATDEQKIHIRLAAAARLWRDTKQLQGFLLTGEALKLGAKYRNADTDINLLVEASEKAGRKRSQLVRLIAALSLIVAVSSLLTAHRMLFPWLANWEARAMLKADAGRFRREWQFERIAFYRSFMPPSDAVAVYFTAGLFKDLRLDEISLPGANFIQAQFKKVEFDGAELPNSLFVEAPVMDDVDFSGANLENASFRGSGILTADFSDANLQRAIFDNSTLCKVDFGGANLGKASFRDVTIDDFDGFSNVGWWHASGWGSANYLNLLKVRSDPKALAHSEAFRDQFNAALKFFADTRSGTFERASALNRYALMLATWGFPDGHPTKQAHDDITRERRLDDGLDRSCMPRKNVRALDMDGIPASALDAATQAVCILEKLPETDQQKQLLQKARDTLGYIHLQKRDIPAALRVYDQSAEDPVPDDGGRDFRHAIAVGASGDSAQAGASLEKSLRRYVPGHEMWTLRSILLKSDGSPGELMNTILGTIDKRWPASGRTCAEVENLAEQWLRKQQ